MSARSAGGLHGHRKSSQYWRGPYMGCLGGLDEREAFIQAEEKFFDCGGWWSLGHMSTGVIFDDMSHRHGLGRLAPRGCYANTASARGRKECSLPPATGSGQPPEPCSVRQGAEGIIAGMRGGGISTDCPSAARRDR